MRQLLTILLLALNLTHVRADFVIKKQMRMIKGQGPTTSDLPGMVVKSQSVSLRETITETLISAKEEPGNPADFSIPNDYHVIRLQVTTIPPPVRQ